ncbi:MAG: glycoside hydrolase family 3 protein [Chlorobium phaeobacteroides]|jgi:beta-N-acetylhexosaminidase|nr:glycoside hydrolase family 3 protein [Chlorobium phaeobacteroides]
MKRNRFPLSLLIMLLMLQTPAAWAAKEPDSLGIKIGQMIMTGFRGCSLAESPQIASDIRRQRIGGVVLFDYDVPSRSPIRNITTPSRLMKLTRELQRITEIPLLIAIDQEGGRVNRLKPALGFPPSLSAARLGKLDNTDSTTAEAAKTAETLKTMHLSMNLAPVVDLNSNKENPVIGKLQRSFSDDPDVVTRNARATCNAFREKGIIATLKHFPGHGSSTTDTHKGFTDITGTWRENELQPYRQLIAGGYNDAIMTAHVYNATIDSLYPATLSKKTLKGILREKLGFRGVIITDDMQMKAIADHYGLEEALRLAIEADADILLFGNNTTFDPDIARKAIAIIRTMVSKKIITTDRIDRSYRRIMTLKERYLFQCK